MPENLYQIDTRNKLPLYHLIENSLRAIISRGDVAPGEMLPPESELARSYGVSRLTVRRALDELVRENWLSRRHGVGTFVKKPARATITASKLSFTEQMKAVGRTPGSLLLEKRRLPAPPEIARLLKVEPGAFLLKLARLRLADEVPILHETAFLPLDRFPGLDQAAWQPGDSLYHILREKYGVVVTGLDHTIKPALLTGAQAAYFHVKAGLPSLISEIVAFTDAGEPVEYSLSISNGDKGEFYFRFRQIEAEERRSPKKRPASPSLPPVLQSDHEQGEKT